ncbi:MAG: SUMF1/EgtB/PvdO family nonheme iron enzyme [Polyangiales bacterium]
MSWWLDGRAPRRVYRRMLCRVLALGLVGCTPYMGSAASTPGDVHAALIDATVTDATSVAPADRAVGTDTDTTSDDGVGDAGAPEDVTRCDDVTVDLRSDERHCGACGRACVNGVCADGACAVRPQRSCADAATPGCGLVEVGGGEVTLGGEAMCSDHTSRKRGCVLQATPPVPDVRVSTFWLDAHLVTVARYRAFFAGRATPSGVPAPVRYPDGTTLTVGAAQEPETTLTNRFCNWTPYAAQREAHPINCVDWAAAQRFCQWDGGRLPTEAEWEYAARGRAVDGLTEGRVYPWGDEVPAGDCARGAWLGCAGDDGAVTRRVGGSAPVGGIFDLVGNVTVWAADTTVPYDSGTCWRGDLRDPLCNVNGGLPRALRSSAFGDPPDTARVYAASRTWNLPSARVAVTGFRCARSP